MNTSPSGWIAGSGFWVPRPSSSVMLFSRFAAARAFAAAPGSTTAVGVSRRPFVRVIVPKRPYSNVSPIARFCGSVTYMPSSASRCVSVAGSVSGTARRQRLARRADLEVERLELGEAEELVDLACHVHHVADRDRRRRSAKCTKMPSEVAVSPSPASWM